MLGEMDRGSCTQDNHEQAETESPDVSPCCFSFACARGLGAKVVAPQHQHPLDQGDFNPLEHYVQRLEV